MSSSSITVTKIGEPIEMLMNVNLADAEFNKMLQKQSTKLLAAFGYKLISKISSQYDIPFEELCEVAGLKKKKSPAVIKTEKAPKPELTEEEKAVKKAALIARLAEGRAKKAAEKAATLAQEGSEISSQKSKKEKPELTEEEKVAKRKAAAEKRKATLAAKKIASSGSESECTETVEKSKKVKPELSEEEKAAKRKAATDKRKATIEAKKKAEFDAKVKAVVAELTASSSSGSESD